VIRRVAYGICVVLAVRWLSHSTLLLVLAAVAVGVVLVVRRVRRGSH